MRFEKSCGAVIIRKFEGVFKVLLVKHIKGGHWSFPKGHMEKEEVETETVIREVLEETGLEVILDIDFRYVVTYSPKKEVTKNVIYFLAICDKGEVFLQENELKQAEWLTFQEAEKRVSFDSDLALLASSSEYIQVKYR